MMDNELREYQLESANLLKEFIAFCKAENLTVYAFYGTLLGTIRHKGFIPWDDDVDLIMPRKDFDNLIELSKANLTHSIKLLTDGNSNYYKLPIIRVVAKSNCSYMKYICMDVFCLDEISENQKIQKKCKRYSYLYHLCLMREVPKNKNKIVKIGCYIFLFILPNKIIDKMLIILKQKLFINTSGNCYIDYFGDKKKFVFSKKSFSEVLWKKFEDIELPLPKGYADILKIVYDNYNDLPPIEERVPPHPDEEKVNKWIEKECLKL